MSTPIKVKEEQVTKQRNHTEDQGSDTPWAFGYVADLWSKPVTSAPTWERVSC